jgi:hypothetical protein
LMAFQKAFKKPTGAKKAELFSKSQQSFGE